MSKTQPTSGDASSSVVFARAISAWIAVLGLSYLLLADAVIDVDRWVLTVPGDPEWSGLPWRLSPRELLLGAVAMTAFALLASALLWRVTQLGRYVASTFLVIVAAYGAFAASDYRSWVLVSLNAWLALALLRQARLQNNALQLTRPAQAMEPCS